MTRTRLTVGSTAALGAALVIAIANGLSLPSVIALLAGLVVAVLIWWWGTRNPAGQLIERVRAEPVDLVQNERLAHVVHGLCLSHGIAEPRLWIIPTHSRNAMAVVDRSGSHLVFTKGLLAEVDRLQLEGLVAHLLVRLGKDDIAEGTRAAALTTRTPWRLLPIGPWLVGESQHIVDVDMDAVSLTRFPPGLIGGLQILFRGETAIESASPSISHLWIDDRFGGTDAIYHPLSIALADRIEVLQEL